MTPDNSEARAVAAEVVLARITDAIEPKGSYYTFAVDVKNALRMAPDLTAARELIRKAREADALARTVAVMREALDNLRSEAGMSSLDSYHMVEAREAALVALRLPLPGAVKIAAAERAVADAVMAFQEMNDSVMAGDIEFNDYDSQLLPLLRARETALAALKAARGKV